MVNPHHTKVFILKPDGSEVPLATWQDEVGYEVGSARIARHFWFTEPKFMDDLSDYGKLVVCEPLMKIADRYRDIKAAPVKVNSFNRSRAKQESLITQGFKAASISPHEYFLAIDVDTDTEEESRLNAAMIRVASKALGIKVRIGYEEYFAKKQTFVHFDVCPEYFGVGKVWHSKPHPKQWETENQW